MIDGACWKLGLNQTKPVKRQKAAGGGKAKRKRLEGWGESTEKDPDIRRWLLNDDIQERVMRDKLEETLRTGKTVKMKQLEIDFGRVLKENEGPKDNDQEREVVENKIDIEVEDKKNKQKHPNPTVKVSKKTRITKKQWQQQRARR